LSSYTSAQSTAIHTLTPPGWPGYDLSGRKCTGKNQGYGPYDYTNPTHRKKKLPTITESHFDKEVETLKGRLASISGDIDYTLRAFPNHHRALYAISRFHLRNPDLRNMTITPAAECYFQRAIKFAPQDYRSMQLYANYLIKRKQSGMAQDVYKRALTIKNAPPEINYALGLLYVDLKKYDEAVEQAKIAYDAGLKKTKLARKLKEVNRWPAQ